MDYFSVVQMIYPTPTICGLDFRARNGTRRHKKGRVLKVAEANEDDDILMWHDVADMSSNTCILFVTYT